MTESAKEAEQDRAAAERLVRHKLIDRIYHWLMAASVLVLLVTSFFPILGVKFAWVTIHWIAGLVLTATVLYHIVRALVWQDRSAMAIGRRDARDAWRSIQQFLGRSDAAPPKAGKYSLLQKLYHYAAAAVVLLTVATGAAMLAKIDTPFWRRDPYWLSDQAWGLVYVVHGLAALCAVTLVMAHVYFAVRPEKLLFTRSMIRGWITRKEYQEHHDPERWAAFEAVDPPRKPAQDAVHPAGAPTES